MTPQLIALLAADVALFIIAYSVLRLYQQRIVTAPIDTGPVIHVKRDVFQVDTADPHYPTIIHSAIEGRYHFSERRSGIETYVRREYHGPAATWR